MSDSNTIFDLQPTLLGKTLKLHPLQISDFEKLFAAAADPLIWELHPQSDRYQRPVFQKYFEGAMESRGAFTIECNGHLIGSSRYYDLSSDLSQVKIGYTFLTRKHWGGDTNRELKYLMLSHAFRFVPEVIFEVGMENLRSRGAMVKIGGELCGENILDGKNHVLYRITQNSFQKWSSLYP